jgi:hypothetical protein
MTVTVTVKGDKELQRKLSRLKPKHLTGALKVMGDHVVTKVKPYPAQPATTYQRTFQLMDGWKVKPKKQDFAVEVSNPTPYGVYVQSDDRQAGFHRSAGWKRLRETTVKEMDELVKILKIQVDRILEGR